jgi:SpoVK/Ycf46/Vps4 family AAA+-type ATPase
MRAVKRVIAGTDRSVLVSSDDFDEAVRNCAPSVSMEELAFYEKLKF